MEDFENLSEEEQTKKVDELIEADIRPMLSMDGGNLEIINVQKGDKTIDVFIRYLGACAGCSLGATSTLFAIEDVLKNKLSQKIKVVPI